MFEIRDPIHRTIPFSPHEKRVIDHPYVQRLRHVRQLGLASLVYPGATHDRFSHGLGAMHVAGRMWARMRESSGQVLAAHFSDEDLAYFGRILRLSGLLHDLGHPPFSHISEPFMPQFNALALPHDWFLAPSQDRQATHEDYSVLLIAALAEGADAPLARNEAQDIASLVHHGVLPSPAWERRFGSEAEDNGIHRMLRSFISGEMDCDRMDYLLRDAYFTGVTYGQHDLEQLVGNVGAVDLGEGGLVRTIDATAVRAFEDFLLARYHMFLQVYHHKTSIAFDTFLERAIHGGELECVVPGDAASYARLRDDTMWERLFAAAENPANVWSRRLVYRVPPKMLLSCVNANAEEKSALDRAVASLEACGVPHFVIASNQKVSKAAPAATVSAAQSAMLVRRTVLGEDRFETIEAHSGLLNRYNEAMNMTMLYVLREDADAAMRCLRPSRKSVDK